jgi:glyoxylase-like metal-dependent hydrolase (beta-lactamase superfamily II)
VEVGGRTVELIEVGPAHTAGDTIVHVPDASTVYTGDILFIGGAPIVWAGPLSNWVAACDLMLSMDVGTVVPGHGPVTDADGIVAVRDYLRFVDTEASGRFEAGMDAFDAARDIGRLLGADERFSELGEFGRIAVNVEAVYREHDPTHESPDVVEQFRRMAELEGI